MRPISTWGSLSPPYLRTPAGERRDLSPIRLRLWGNKRSLGSLGDDQCGAAALADRRLFDQHPPIDARQLTGDPRSEITTPTREPSVSKSASK